MKLIHVTDVHLTAGRKPIAGLHPYDNFSRCLKHIAQVNGDADRMVITGDLAHKGEPDAYQQLTELLDDFPIPTDLVIGNHDVRDNFFAAFPEAYKDDHGFVQGTLDTPAGRFVFMDTAGERSHAGFYDDKRFDWLTEVLVTAASDRVKVCLFMHHHPRNVGVTPCDTLGLQSQDRMRALLTTYRDNIRYLFFGHCHMPLSGMVAGIPFASLRGTNHQVIPDFTGAKAFKMAALNPAYNVVFFDDEDVVVHTVDYSFAGDYREVGTGWEDWQKYG